MKLFNYSFPTQISYGVGARNLVAEILNKENLGCPLVVTDAGYAELGDFKAFVESLKKHKIGPRVYAGVQGNPTKSQVLAGVEQFKAEDCNAIIGIGGGAALDVTKAIGLMATNYGDLFDYNGTKPVEVPLPYFIALPTTAGTGSEVARASVISDDETKAKNVLFAPQLLAKRVLIDPELTEKLPAKVTAATGMDALTHLVESYISNEFHPMCEGIALEGIKIVSEYLEKSVTYADHPPGNRNTHLHVRGMMMNAAMMGAVAFQKELGAVHSCAHALSTVNDLHHGLANAVMMPVVLRWNREACPHKFEAMAQAVGAEDFVAWTAELNTKIGIPNNLKDVGTKKEDLFNLVEFAMADVCHQFNPRKLEKQDFEQIFSEALGL